MDRIKTFTSVALLSCMIWYFCEKNVKTTETITLQVQLTSSDETDMSFMNNGNSNGNTVTTRVTLTVEGAAGLLKSAKVDEAFKEITPELLFSAQDRKVSGTHRIDVVSRLLGRELTINGRLIAVVGSKPAELNIALTPLVEKTIPIEIYDESGEQLTGIESIEPKEITAFVKQDEAFPKAIITLSAQDKLKAIKEPLSLKYKVNGKTFAQEILVKLSPQARQLAKLTVSKPRLSVVLPYLAVGKYKVVVESDEATWNDNAIEVRGSDEAVSAYKVISSHFILEIKEEDIPGTQYERLLKYATTQLHNDLEIVNEQPAFVKFHLEPLVKVDTTLVK